MREDKKAVKIISELIIYFLSNGAASINMDFKIEKEANSRDVIISFKGILPELTASKLNQLKKELSTSRETQVEEYYWELAGEGSSAGELSLVGMLTDKVIIDYKDSILEITLWRQD